MGTRLELHEVLCDLLGSRKVYFQPPEGGRLSYPCIVYSLTYVDIRHADNRPYKWMDQYQVTLIDSDPDTKIRRKIEQLPRVKFSNKFTSDNLHHFVYQLDY